MVTPQTDNGGSHNCQRLFLSCPKCNQFFLGAARIECKKFEVSTMSRFGVIVYINMFSCLLACRKCILLFSRQWLNQFQFCFLQKLWNSGHNILYINLAWLFCLLFPKIVKNWFLNLTKFTRGTQNQSIFWYQYTNSILSKKYKKMIWNLKTVRKNSKIKFSYSTRGLIYSIKKFFM